MENHIVDLVKKFISSITSATGAIQRGKVARDVSIIKDFNQQDCQDFLAELGRNTFLMKQQAIGAVTEFCKKAPTAPASTTTSTIKPVQAAQAAQAAPITSTNATTTSTADPNKTKIVRTVPQINKTSTATKATTSTSTTTTSTAAPTTTSTTSTTERATSTTTTAAPTTESAIATETIAVNTATDKSLVSPPTQLQIAFSKVDFNTINYNHKTGQVTFTDEQEKLDLKDFLNLCCNNRSICEEYLDQFAQKDIGQYNIIHTLLPKEGEDCASINEPFLIGSTITPATTLTHNHEL